jgi:hypothetical protein
VHGADVVSVGPELDTELERRELLDDGEGENVAEQPDDCVVAAHVRRGVQVPVAQEELQRERAGHIGVGGVGQLVRVEERHDGPLRCRILGEQIPHRLPLRPARPR